MHDAIVIGGGIAGLSCAWKLKQAGLDVLVLEAQPQAGGNIRSVEHEGYLLELGPYSVMGGSETLWQMVEELGIEQLAVPSAAAADNRYIYRDGRLLPLPLSLGGFLRTRLLSTRAKLRLMAEPFIRSGARPDDTAWQFFVRRFGEEAATYVMGPFVSGVYAGDPRILGTRAAFPKFYDFEHSSGSMIRGAVKYMLAKRRRLKREGIKVRKGLFSFTGGLGRLTGELAARLGAQLITGSPVTAVGHEGGEFIVDSASGEHRSRMLICAVPPPAAAHILGRLIPGVAQPLQSMPMSPVTLIHWSQPAAGHVPPGFGFLMPRHYGLRVLGTIFASQLFPGRAPAGRELLSSFYGGMTDQQFMELTDTQALDIMLAEHRRILSADVPAPEMMRIFRYPGAIPQLTPEHPEKLAEVERNLAAYPGLFLAGNYLTGVGVEHAVASGYNAYAQALAHRGGQAEMVLKRAKA